MVTKATCQYNVIHDLFALQPLIWNKLFDNLGMLSYRFQTFQEYSSTSFVPSRKWSNSNYYQEVSISRIFKTDVSPCEALSLIFLQGSYNPYLNQPNLQLSSKIYCNHEVRVWSRCNKWETADICDYLVKYNNCMKFHSSLKLYIKNF